MRTHKLVTTGLLALACGVLQIALSGGNGQTPKPGWCSFPVGQIAGLEPDTEIEVDKTDGSFIRGKFLGMDTLSTSEYAGKYLRSLGAFAKTHSLPKLGDTLSVNRRVTGVFVGFDPELIRLQIESVDVPRSHPLRVSDTLYDNHGNVFSGGELRKQIVLGGIPFLSRVFVSSGADTSQIPLDSILTVSVPISNRTANQKLGELADGAARGILIVAVITIPLVMMLSQLSNWGR